MATTTASHYLLAHVDADGRVRDHRELGAAPGPAPAFWAVRLSRFWPANRPGERNNPWHRESAVGRDRGALCLHVGPLLRTAGDLDATGIHVFDVSVRGAQGDTFPVVPLHCLLPAKVRAGDGLFVQADLVDLSLFTHLDQIMVEAGRILERRPHRQAELHVALGDTMALFSDIGSAVLNALWGGVLRPSGIDARAWNPRQAQFHLYGSSLNDHPQVRPGTYLLAGLWSPLDLSGTRYDPAAGLCHCGDPTRRVTANVLEFELLALRG